MFHPIAVKDKKRETSTRPRLPPFFPDSLRGAQFATCFPIAFSPMSDVGQLCKQSANFLNPSPRAKSSNARYYSCSLPCDSPLCTGRARVHWCWPFFNFPVRPSCPTGSPSSQTSSSASRPRSDSDVRLAPTRRTSAHPSRASTGLPRSSVAAGGRVWPFR